MLGVFNIKIVLILNYCLDFEDKSTSVHYVAKSSGIVYITISTLTGSILT